jgi:hypothetical protein
MPETDINFQSSMVEAVRDLRARFPHAPFLTLGQTVLWDEPVKAAFCRVLEDLAPDATIVAAIHDTDYFAKLSHLQECDQKFVLLEHNDGDTRDLWSAAGEISCLLGSETLPTRHKLVENGVAFERVAREYSGGATALLNQETAAWGWRAIVHTEPKPLLAGEVLLRDIAPILLEQLRWAFDESLRCIGSTPLAVEEGDANCSCPQPCESREVAGRITRWVEEYTAANEDATLSQLYRALTPRLWALVRGEGSCNLQTSHSLKLFRFNRETAKYPRFKFLELFLDTQIRENAKACYDDAVRGSGIYTLDQFGMGALPFDVVIPGRGRGTLRVQKNSIAIETEPPIFLKCDDCDSVEKLATTLEEKFGDEVVIVGKAVTLISMLAHELIFVFHEKASSYTKLTRKMNASLRARGIEMNLHPLLRLEYSTWDALANVEARFVLPAHLENAFGKKEISAREFSERWQEVCQAQDAAREKLKNCRAPRELMQFFAIENAAWQNRQQEYSRAREVISNLSREARVLQSQSAKLRESAKKLRDCAAQIEREKGEDFRSHMLPLLRRIGDIKETAFARLNALDENGNPRKLSKSERLELAALEQREEAEVQEVRARIEVLKTERAQFDERIQVERNAAAQSQSEARVLIAQRVELESSAQAVAAREAISHLEYEAELGKLRRVRDAIITSESLRYTNVRPTAWWLPLVSPDGKWFESLAKTAHARIEEI